MRSADAESSLIRPAPGDGTMITLPSGTSLFVEFQGTRRPVLILHGGLGLDHTYFQPWLDPLAGDLRLVYPDLRGNGRSAEHPVEEYTHDRMVEDLDALREALGIEQWAVLAHSYGGFIAQLYALAYPETISHLVLVDTSPAPLQLGNAEGMGLVSDRLTPERMAALSSFFAGAFDSDEQWKQIWRTILPLYVHDYDVRSLIASDRTVYRASVAKHVFANELPSFDTRSRLSQITIPTLVTVGRYDWIMTVQHAQVLHEGIPRSTLAIFDRSGHFPFIEEQDRFLSVVRAFLAVWAEPDTGDVVSRISPAAGYSGNKVERATA